MSRVVILGTSSAVAFKGHQNTHLVIEGEEHCILVDCVGHAGLRLGEVGIDIRDLTGVILTHFHPDHVSGLPLLLMNMWLLDRETPLDIYGADHALSRLEKMMGLFDWKEWPDMFPVEFQRLPLEEMRPVVSGEALRVYTSPVQHLIPTLGMRIEYVKEDFVVAYSCDTDPCEQTVRLARDGDVLIHEAAGEYEGHTSPAEAGEIAAKAGVDTLYLIHYSFHRKDAGTMIREASERFPGQVALAKDLMEIEVPGGTTNPE